MASSEVSPARDFSFYKQLAKELKSSVYRESISSSTIFQLADDLVEIFGEIKQLDKFVKSTEKQWTFFHGVLECLRNSCISCQRNQFIIIKENSVLETAVSILKFDHDKQCKDFDTSFGKIKKLSLQFLGNLVAGNKFCQNVVWQKMFPKILTKLMETLPISSKEVLCMVIYNCVLERKEVWSRKEFSMILVKVTDLIKTTDSEWGMMLLEKMVFEDRFPEVCNHLKDYHTQRLVLLDLLEAYISDDAHPVPEGAVSYVSDLYKDSLDSIKSLEDNEEARKLADLNPLLLKILCASTGSQKYKVVAKDGSLLECAVCHLIEVSMRAKESRDSESLITRKSENVLGLKRDLVRLIGNLCYKNKENQDKVRDLDGIPVILDNCRIDDNNPYIGQWAVFAIRNLCENNTENQQLISMFEQKGLANETEFEKLGMSVKMVDGKIQIGSQKPQS